MRNILMDFYPFEIKIEQINVEVFRVTAYFMGITRSHESVRSMLMLTNREIGQAHEWLERGFFSYDYAQEFGNKLFNFVFRGEVLRFFEQAKAYVKPNGGLRLLFHFPPFNLTENLDAFDLAKLPWELMYDSQYGFLAHSRFFSLVRHDPRANLPNPLPQTGSLRVLLIAAQPENCTRICGETEIETIAQLLTKKSILSGNLVLIFRHLYYSRTLKGLVQRLVDRHRFIVEPCLHATRSKINTTLNKARDDQRPFHIIHFIGHGDHGTDGSHLILESEEGNLKADRVPASDFVHLIKDHSINLVIYNGCETGAVGGFLQSIAHQTLNIGVPAVIGMRFEILDKTAIRFSKDFYASLASGQPIEAALSTARRLTLRETYGQTVDWSIPILFMGWQSGLTLPRMSIPLVTVFNFIGQVIVSVLFILSLISTSVDIPELYRRTRTELPIVKCIAPFPMDENKFTVAFYAFEVQDTQGRKIPFTDDGRKVAKFLFGYFKRNFDQLQLNLPYEFRPPQHTCPINGSTAESRSEMAAREAERINADVIIYGVITESDESARLDMEFYVAYQGFDEGEEIIGGHALGRPLPLEMPFNPKTLLVIYQPIHAIYMDIISQIIVALSYYSADDFEAAIPLLELAQQNDKWANSDGKEIVHLLLGNAYLRLASRSKEYDTLLPTAQKHYQTALTLNPSYMRAKIGLASALYLESLAKIDPTNLAKVNEEVLARSESTYRAALNSAKTSKQIIIEYKARFGLAQIDTIRFIKSNGEDSAAWQRARREFEKIGEARLAGNTDLTYLASHSFHYLGFFSKLAGDWEDAIHYYQQATVYASPFYETIYSHYLAQAYCANNNYGDAVRVMEKAIDIARLHGYTEQVDVLANLIGEGCPYKENLQKEEQDDGQK